MVRLPDSMSLRKQGVMGDTSVPASNSELQSTANGGIIGAENNADVAGADINGGEQVYNGSERIGRESGNSESSLGRVQETNGGVSRVGKINRVIG